MRQREVIRLVQTILRRVKGKHRPKLIAAAVVVGLVFMALQPMLEKRGITMPSILGHTVDSSQVSEGEAAILSAFKARKSDVIIEGTAIVKKILPDDTTGDQHQKMLLRLPSGHTLLLAHNIDLADRVPVDEGDAIEFKGEYEYSLKGGVLHWTHHDPGRRHVDGWLRHRGLTYQ